MDHFIYILQSEGGQYYTGYTTNIDRRLKEHQTGSGGKFTRSFGAKKILYSETFASKSEALKRETQIKNWTRSKKEALISGNKIQLKQLSMSRQSPKYKFKPKSKNL